MRLVLLVQGLYGIKITRDGTNIGFVTSAIETNLALITASAPALRPIFRSRERGGWLPRTLVDGQSRIADAEMGQQKPVDWDNRPSTSGGGTKGGTGKLGRGGSRGGGARRGSTRSARSTRSGRGGKIKPIIRVRTDLAELRSQSPRSSEEETMTNNGIMRVSDIQREIDGIAKEIGASRSYTRKTDSFAGPRPLMAGSSGGRPGTAPGGGRRYPPERYYSESVYPDAADEYDESRADRDYDDERMSRYGDRRFGVVTPKGTTPTSRTWREEGGRPF